MLCLHLYSGWNSARTYNASAILILSMHKWANPSICPLLWFLFVGMLIWPEWLAEQNNCVYFCLKQHIKCYAEVKNPLLDALHCRVLSVGDIQSMMYIKLYWV